VLANLAATDGRKLRAAWVSFSDAELADGGDGGDAAAMGPPGFEDMWWAGAGGAGRPRGRRRGGGSGAVAAQAG
jgi:hypothetical protein